MKEKSLEKYNELPALKAVILNALPAVAAMLMTLIYNLADTFFIGKTGDAYQVAAVSLATPVFLIFMAVGQIFGIGGTSVISRALGENKKEFAKKVCSFAMWSCIFLGIALTVLILVFLDPLLSVIGASESTWEYTKTYLTIVSFSGVFALVSSCFSNILRAEGQANKAMMGQVVGNLLNMCLDAVFIMGFHWDIVGCALATLIGEFAGAAFYLYYYFAGKTSLSVKIKDFTVKESTASSVLIIGVPAALGSLLMSVSSILMNAQMAKYGDMAVAGIGVAMKVVMITGMISMGIGMGIQPLLGYCVGAKSWDRFKQYMKYSIGFATILGAVLTALCYLFMNQIVSAFLSDAAAFDYAISFARIMICTGPLFGIFYCMTNSLQAMGAATSSLIINISRQGIVYIPALFLLGAAFGATGLAWAQPAADVISFVMALIMYAMISRKLMKTSSEDHAEQVSYGDAAAV